MNFTYTLQSHMPPCSTWSKGHVVLPNMEWLITGFVVTLKTTNAQYIPGWLVRSKLWNPSKPDP